mmetsp:Transcript_13302/g.34171  ORF Transcript_13302/g.34171 Transcript_13302/m.34171 type:complete len:363 (+) Transcript_13302:127-1215(+)
MAARRRARCLNLGRRPLLQHPEAVTLLRLRVRLHRQEMQPARGLLGGLPRIALRGGLLVAAVAAVAPAVGDARLEDEARAVGVGGDGGELQAVCPRRQRLAAAAEDGHPGDERFGAQIAAAGGLQRKGGPEGLARGYHLRLTQQRAQGKLHKGPLFAAQRVGQVGRRAEVELVRRLRVRLVALVHAVHLLQPLLQPGDDGEAAPAGDHLDVQVRQRAADDGLHLPAEVAHLFGLLRARQRKQRLQRLAHLRAVHQVVGEVLRVLKGALRVAHQQLPHLLPLVVHQRARAKVQLPRVSLGHAQVVHADVLRHLRAVRAGPGDGRPGSPPHRPLLVCQAHHRRQLRAPAVEGAGSGQGQPVGPR